MRAGKGGFTFETMFLTLPGGTRVRVRPIAPEDKTLLVEGLRRLSPESAFRRFMSPKVSFSDGDKPSASVEGVGDLSIEPLMGPDGKPTVVRNAMFGFAPEFVVGRSSGQAEIVGKAVELKYGETAPFEYTSETTDVHARA